MRDDRRRRRRRAAAAVLLSAFLVGAVASGGPAGAGSASSDRPMVSGPVTGGSGVPTLVSTPVDLPELGYIGAEYFLEGTATAYEPTGALGSDGKWEVTPAGTAPYRTRILVSRPERAKDFNGTVFVEWLNVSAGFDTSPDWSGAHTEIARSGAVWVGVSAQAVGVQGGQEAVGGVANGGLKAADPERYATLRHPGDAFSFDMFTQAGQAVRGQADTDPLDGLKAKRVIAMGQSQSSRRLLTYVNAVHGQAGVYDGFLLHSRSNPTGASLGAEMRGGGRDPALPDFAVVRNDIDVPVLTYLTESDVLEFVPARQPDTKKVRLWEAVGTSHTDEYLGSGGFEDVGDGAAERALLDMTALSFGPLNCGMPINKGPNFAVLNAAVYQLDRWVRTGTPPPKAPRIAITDGTVPEIVRDEHTIARGGIRTPLVDAPIAALTGAENTGGTFCGGFGTTMPFDAETLAELYPTNADYVRQFRAASASAVKAGFLRPADARLFNAAAAQLDIGQ